MNPFQDTLRMNLKGKRILVVEDDSALRKTLSRILARINSELQVKWVKSADDFFLTEPHKPRGEFDLVITDIYMPGMCSGFEIWNHFERATKKTPVVMMSGLSQYEFLRAMGLSAIVPAYLEKPLNFSECRAMIEGLLMRESSGF